MLLLRLSLLFTFRLCGPHSLRAVTKPKVTFSTGVGRAGCRQTAAADKDGSFGLCERSVRASSEPLYLCRTQSSIRTREESDHPAEEPTYKSFLCLNTVMVAA